MSKCACHSGARYLACCAPYHRGAAAPNVEALMRSRYAAFALGLGDYLYDTLASDHEDRTPPRAEVVRSYKREREANRYVRLAILHTTETEVLFYAGIFRKGDDLSFVELSTFVREAGAWRYASGELVSADRLPADPTALDPASFRRLSRGQGS